MKLEDDKLCDRQLYDLHEHISSMTSLTFYGGVNEIGANKILLHLFILEIKQILYRTTRPYTTILVDNKHTLSIELRDDTKSDVEEAIGRAIYSTTAISIADAYFKFNSVQNPVFAPVSEWIPPNPPTS